ncbi:MAG: hypothetical protein ACP5N2_03835 [Candidatus Nanoarchaeia archaeon]
MTKDKLISKKILKELKLEKLTELEFDKNGFTRESLAQGNYALLGLGQLFISYHTKVVEGDAMAARMCDAESENVIEVSRIKYGSITPKEIPASTTHYLLGERFYEEHEYMSGKSEASNTWPVMFLKEK